jgi:ubiquinone/menaquinone biosynthesis C-methylase UbiE
MSSTSDSTRGQVVASAAEVYERFFVPALFEQWADPIIDLAGVRAGDDVLDLGCGTGVVARAAAPRVGAAGSVIGLDRNEAMLAVARRIEPDLDWRDGVGEAIPLEAASVDRVVSAFVLMFVDDRGQVLREVARILRPGGSVAVATWAAVTESPGYAAMVEVLDHVVGSHAADALRVPFCIGTADEVADLLSTTFEGVRVVRREGTARFDSIESWLHTDIRGWTLADSIDDGTYDELLAAARSTLTPFVDGAGHVEFAAPALIGVGRVAS